MEERLDRIIELLEELKAGLPARGWDCDCYACRNAVVPSEEVLEAVKKRPELAVIHGDDFPDDLESLGDYEPEGA